VDSVQYRCADQLLWASGSKQLHGSDIGEDYRSLDMHQDRVRRKLDQRSITSLALLQSGRFCLQIADGSLQCHRPLGHAVLKLRIERSELLLAPQKVGGHLLQSRGLLEQINEEGHL